MASDPPAQRAWRAACPQCGAPVEFASSASAFAVCSFCRSTVVRDGDALRRIGQSAELFDDHTPLQLGASGRYQGAAFTLVGRLQLRYAEGTWNEWFALFDGTGPAGAGAADAGGPQGGWLSEDNGRYVIAFDAALAEPPPSAEKLRVGTVLMLQGQRWSVASVTAAKVIAAQGELPQPPNLARGFVVADLRNAQDEVGTLDYGDPAAPRWSVGRSVALDALQMTGLATGVAAAAEKTLKARGVECPSCGAALEVKLSTTQSIACHQCHAVVDVSGGVGAELHHYAQANGDAPQIPLGSTGTLTLGAPKALPWQVVGYVERCEVPESSDDDQVFWREYLLYHRTQGFAFLVDAEDGWSWTVPITGVPEPLGDDVKYRGVRYKKLYDYTGKITYVLGEFYWKLERDQRTFNTDYRGTGSFGNKQLNRERTQSGGDARSEEVVWSAGESISAESVRKAFRLPEDKAAALRRDVTPTSGNAASLLAKLFFWGFLVVILLILFRCDASGPDCEPLRSTYGDASAEYRNCLASRSSSRTSGGSWGGYSSGGGGHK